MTHVHFQPVGGAAGDMTLASLVAAGADRNVVVESLQGLGVPFDLSFEDVEVNGVGSVSAHVSYPRENMHRTYRDIETMVSSAHLPQRAAGWALSAFHRLAFAESKVHGKPPEEVAFHEVGAVDSIVDMVGSCVALDLLGAESITCEPLPMGGGVVKAAHGPLPVPGPATLEVLEGSKVRWPEVDHEMTTPTGAALMWAFTGGEFTSSPPPMKLQSVGYGAGAARFADVPNLLRAVVGEIEGPSSSMELLESNADDVSGEVLGAAVGKLMDDGALDAWLEPIFMKKGRGAYKVCALVEKKRADDLARLLMRETGLLGVRRHAVGRTVAERRTRSVELPYGTCRVKVGSLDGEDFVTSPEYEDVISLSKSSGVSVHNIYSDILKLPEDAFRP